LRYVKNRNEVKPMNVQQAIVTRLSIRQYTEASISPEHMQTLLQALQLAASANNQQNWEFVFVKDPELKRKLVPACMSQRFVADCSYFIAGVVDPRLKWHMVDITISLTNFTLQAVELGENQAAGMFHGAERILKASFIWIDSAIIGIANEICDTSIMTGRKFCRGFRNREYIIWGFVEEDRKQ
jgi:hypothetical protein